MQKTTEQDLYMALAASMLISVQVTTTIIVGSSASDPWAGSEPIETRPDAHPADLQFSLTIPIVDAGPILPHHAVPVVALTGPTGLHLDLSDLGVFELDDLEPSDHAQNIEIDLPGIASGIVTTRRRRVNSQTIADFQAVNGIHIKDITNSVLDIRVTLTPQQLLIERLACQDPVEIDLLLELSTSDGINGTALDLARGIEKLGESEGPVIGSTRIGLLRSECTLPQIYTIGLGPSEGLAAVQSKPDNPEAWRTDSDRRQSQLEMVLDAAIIEGRSDRVAWISRDTTIIVVGKLGAAAPDALGYLPPNGGPARHGSYAGADVENRWRTSLDSDDPHGAFALRRRMHEAGNPYLARVPRSSTRRLDLAATPLRSASVQASEVALSAGEEALLEVLTNDPTRITAEVIGVGGTTISCRLLYADDLGSTYVISAGSTDRTLRLSATSGSGVLARVMTWPNGTLTVQDPSDSWALRALDTTNFSSARFELRLRSVFYMNDDAQHLVRTEVTLEEAR